MDFNNGYMYGGYQPQFNGSRYQVPMQQIQQMPQQNMFPSQMSGTSQDDRIWVPSRAAADAYLIAPNGFATLWDSTKSVFYEKRADASGRPSLREFTYSEKAAPIQEETPNNMEIFESRLDEFNRRLEKLETAKRPKKEAAVDE